MGYSLGLFQPIDPITFDPFTSGTRDIQVDMEKRHLNHPLLGCSAGSDRNDP